jgi:transposase InsO family protein
MAKIMGVSKSGYYEFLRRKKSPRQTENERIKQKIFEIYHDNRCLYGSPRIHRELKKQGEKCSRIRIARLMREEKIQAKMRKKWKTTTKSKKGNEISPNYLNQNFKTQEPNKVWVSDITYVATEEGWLYVAIVMDLFSRKIVGLSMGEKLQTELVTKALEQAITHRQIKEEVMHHSDRGCQYTSKEFKDLSKKYGIKLSMSGKGHCYDNAVAESFFHTLKTEHTNFCNLILQAFSRHFKHVFLYFFYDSTFQFL